MAEGTDKSAWFLALVAAGLGAGALGRYPFAFADDGLVFGIAFALGIVLLALPLLLGEAALGQFRRRNVADAFGPGPWRVAGWAAAVAAVLLAGFLALVAGWAARYVIASFWGSYFDDPDRFFRLVSQGWDALLLAGAAVVVAVGVHVAGTVRNALVATASVALVAAAGFVLWGLWAGGDAGRDAALALDWDLVDGSLVAAAFQQALLPGLVGLGAVATLSMRVPDRSLPSDATLLAIVWVLVPVGIGASLAALAVDEGSSLQGGLHTIFGTIPALFARIGGTAGGMLSGTFFGLLLAGSLAAIVLLLEVPRTMLAERLPDWKPSRSAALAGLAAYLAALPLAFAGALAFDLELALTAIVAPLGGLAVSLHVGWVRPEVLDGFTVGDARHRLDTTLRPALRFVVPALLLLLLVVGTMGALAQWGALERGSGGLWTLVP